MLTACAILIIATSSYALEEGRGGAPDIPVEEGITKEELEGDVKKALKAMEINPENVDIRRFLVITYFHLGEFERALDEQKTVIEVARTPTEIDYYDLGVIYNRLGDNSGRVEAFYNAAILFGSEDSWRQLAIAYVDVKDYEGAAYAYSKTVEFSPDDKEARIQLARNLYRIGDYKAAISELQSIYSSRRDRAVLVISFLGHLAFAFLVLFSLFFVSRSCRLSPIFCDSVDGDGSVHRTLIVIMSVLLLSRLTPYLLFNPFVPHYGEKVIIALCLYHNPAREEMGRYVLTYGLSYVIIPAYYMRKSGISMAPFFALDMGMLKRMARYLPASLFMLLALAVPVAIILTLALPSVSPLRLQVQENIETMRAYSLLGKLSVCLILPLAEEFFFRGMVFVSLRKRFKASWSVFFSALLFMVSHFNLTDLSLLGVLFLGIVTAYLVHKTHSLWPPYVLHATINSAQLFL